jgi:hypothetical protein
MADVATSGDRRLRFIGLDCETNSFRSAQTIGQNLSGRPTSELTIRAKLRRLQAVALDYTDA